MKIPSPVRKGDSVGLIATARKVSRQELAPAIEILESWGLHVICAPNLFGAYDQFSGTDHERAEDLQWSLSHPDIKAVFCVRGGYGTVKMIDQVDFNPLSEHPKWIIGFSDITVLHNILHQQQINSIHATMPLLFEQGKDNESLSSLQKILWGDSLAYEIEGHPLNRKGSVDGQLVGGNLSILYSLSGTIIDLDTADKILFIEDLNEFLYHVDRMMQNLLKSGKLDRIKALIVGGMIDMQDNPIPYGKSAEEIIFDYAEKLNIPSCFGFPAGHVEDNRALILGANYRLVIEKHTARLEQH